MTQSFLLLWTMTRYTAPCLLHKYLRFGKMLSYKSQLNRAYCAYSWGFNNGIPDGRYVSTRRRKLQHHVRKVAEKAARITNWKRQPKSLRAYLLLGLWVLDPDSCFSKLLKWGADLVGTVACDPFFPFVYDKMDKTTSDNLRRTVVLM